jgi:hypothetical protein
MESANAVYQAMGWGKFDQGGWLMPAGAMPGPNRTPVNLTGQPEAVLTPQESQAFVAIAKQLTSQGVGSMGSKQVNVNFYGTQYPNAEQMAAINRDLGLALSGP